MNPTTDELIKIIDGKHWVSEEDYFEAWGRLQGRLDVLEKYLSRVDSTDSARMREEISKIKAVLS